jgi:hypothetical protein
LSDAAGGVVGVAVGLDCPVSFDDGTTTGGVSAGGVAGMAAEFVWAGVDCWPLPVMD